MGYYWVICWVTCLAIYWVTYWVIFWVTGLFVGLLTGLFIGLLTGLFAWLLTGLFGGLLTRLFTGLFTWLFTGLLNGLFTVLLTGLFTGFPNWLFTGLLTGLFTGLFTGSFVKKLSGTMYSGSHNKMLGMFKREFGEFLACRQTQQQSCWLRHKSCVSLPASVRDDRLGVHFTFSSISRSDLFYLLTVDAEGYCCTDHTQRHTLSRTPLDQ